MTRSCSPAGDTPAGERGGALQVQCAGMRGGPEGQVLLHSRPGPGPMHIHRRTRVKGGVKANNRSLNTSFRRHLAPATKITAGSQIGQPGAGASLCKLSRHGETPSRLPCRMDARRGAMSAFQVPLCGGHGARQRPARTINVWRADDRHSANGGGSGSRAA